MFFEFFLYLAVLVGTLVWFFKSDNNKQVITEDVPQDLQISESSTPVKSDQPVDDDLNKSDFTPSPQPLYKSPLKISPLSQEVFKTPPKKKQNSFDDGVSMLTPRSKLFEDMMAQTYPQDTAAVSPINNNSTTSVEKTEKDKRKDYILEEILSTEESYVKGLRTLQNYYIQPIREKQLISGEHFDVIFGDVAIIAGVNESFLAELKKLYFGEGLKGNNLAKLLLHSAHSFKLYTRFIGNYGIAISTLEEEKKKNKKFRKFLEETTMKIQEEVMSNSDVTIDGHLVLPLQVRFHEI